jgi:hypothetical protein
MNTPEKNFVEKLKAFSKAASELSDAWDLVDGKKMVMDEIDPRWPFSEQLYYMALSKTVRWANNTAMSIDLKIDKKV